MAEALTLSEERTGAFRVISVEGELDAIAASQLRDRLEGSPDGETLVVVDLARATFVDSAALGFGHQSSACSNWAGPDRSGSSRPTSRPSRWAPRTRPSPGRVTLLTPSTVTQSGSESAG